MSDENSQGYEPEGIEPGLSENKTKSRSEILKQNFLSVFGQGIGKLSLILAIAAILVGIAFGYRGLSNSGDNAPASTMDVPSAPSGKEKFAPVTENEAKRRAQQAALEAQQALAKGDSYVPRFDPNVVQSNNNETNGSSSFNLLGKRGGPDAESGGAKGMNIRTGSSSARESKDYKDAKNQREKALQKEYDELAKKRDEEVAAKQKEVMEIVKKVLDDDKDGFSSYGAFTTVSHVRKEETPATDKPKATPANGDAKSEITPSSVSNGRKPTINTGKGLYAMLDAEANTDDSNDVFATIRESGKWNGSKVIGHIEQHTDNIAFKFTKLAPPDGRPTMSINAVALREEDAKQGMAEDVDKHYVERYASLGAASLLAGFGRAYSYRPGTGVVSSGGVFTTQTTEPSNKQVIARSVGELGRNFSREIRRDFNRPATYSTPANKGFILYFLDDVYETN